MTEKPVVLKIFKFDPDVEYEPKYKTYEVPWREGLLLLQALKYVRDQLDETLAFRDYCCGCAWCMSCLMTVNGKGTQACSRILEPGETLTVEPMRGFPIIRDLVVDFGVSVWTDEGVFKKMEGIILKKRSDDE